MPSLASRPRLSQPPPPLNAPSSSSSFSPPPPRRLQPQQRQGQQRGRPKDLDAWLDSIVSACDDAVGSRLSGALLQADAAAVAVQKRKEEEMASDRNYERYQRRFGSGSRFSAADPASASAAPLGRQRRRRRGGDDDEEEDEGASSSSYSSDE